MGAGVLRFEGCGLSNLPPLQQVGDVNFPLADIVDARLHDADLDALDVKHELKVAVGAKGIQHRLRVHLGKDRHALPEL